MNEETLYNQLNDKLSDIQERTGRIEEQTTRMQIIEQKADTSRNTSERAETKADNNRTNIKTLWGFISGIIIALVTGYIKSNLGG